MRKVKQFARNYEVFVALLVAILLTAVIFRLSDRIGANPFVQTLPLDAPVQMTETTDARYYITDSSYTLVITGKDNTLCKQIYGGNPEESFDYADEIRAYDGGVFYLLDKSFQDDNVTVQSERIVRFTDYGAHREVVYEVVTAPGDGAQTIELSGLREIRGELCFAAATDDGIRLYRLVDGAAEQWGLLPLPDAVGQVNAFAYSPSGHIAAVTMDGTVHEWDGTRDTILMESAQSADYYSLITEVQYDGEVLYLNDIGQRTVLARYDGVTTKALNPDSFSEEPAAELAAAPLYTGMNVSGGQVCVLVSSYSYDAALDEHVYSYQLGAVNAKGQVQFLTDTCLPSIGWRVSVWVEYLALLFAVLLAIYALLHIIALVRAGNTSGSSTTQVAILLVSLALTFGAATAVFQSCTERYIRMSTANLTNIGYLLEETLDRSALEQFDSPQVFGTEAYAAVDATVQELFAREDAVSDSTYVVIYRVKDNILYEAYRNSGAKPVLYPLAGAYHDSVEEEIAKSGQIYVVKDITLSEGSYSYIDIPLYDKNGAFLALIEIGEDYTSVTEQNSRMIRSIMIQTFMAVIIIMLLLSEVVSAWQAAKGRRLAAKKHTPLPPEVIRPIAFMAFFTANITTAFLPIYSMSLWTENFPLQSEIAAALPLSAELICGAVFSLICGRLLRSRSPKPLCCIGAAFYVAGNLLSIFAKNLWMLIGANSCCGIGTGLLLVSINTWITMQDDEKKQNRGFIQYNAAYLAGMNCGSVVGALVWENYGIISAYFAAAISAGVLLLSVLLLMDSRWQKVEAAISATKESLKSLLTPRVLRYFVCLVVPYLVCASFLSYFFPIIAEQNELSAAEISMAFLISGVISIYVGTTVGETVVERLGVRKSMILASFLYVTALFYLVYRPGILSCYVVIVLFALGDSFGLAAQSVYYAGLPEVERYGQSKSLAVNSTVESVTSAAGSLIFGGVLLLGYRLGILILAVIFLLLLVIFVAGDRRNARAESKAE